MRNCSSLGLSIWGKRNEKGHISGKELYLDDIAPGGVADFPRYGAIVIRRPDHQSKGQRLAGPVLANEFVVEGKTEAELRIVTGSRGRCTAFTTMETVLIVICSLLGIMAIAVTVLLVLLRRQTRAAGPPATLSIQRYKEQQARR